MGREARARLRRQRQVNDSVLLRSSGTEATAEEPRYKISEHIVSTAAPWRDRLGSDPPLPLMSVVHEVAGLIWNVSRLPKLRDRERTLSRIRDDLGPMLPDLPTSMVSDLIQEMYRIAREIDPDDTRLVVGTHVDRLGPGQFHVQAASLRSGES